MDTTRASTPDRAAAGELADDMAGVNALIRARMASEHAPRIPEVTAHLVEAGGKRLRPLLTLAAARLCGYDGRRPPQARGDGRVHPHRDPRCTTTSSTRAQRRRGRPTANLLWDNKSSVLVGDYLFARAFQLMVETGSLRVLDILANASAVIAEGEVLQLTARLEPRDRRGDLPAGGARQDRGALRRGDRGRRRRSPARRRRRSRALAAYGDALGIAFQIADDLLDYGGLRARPRQEHRRRLPRAQDDPAGDPRRRRRATRDERAFWARVIGKGEQRRRRPRAGAGAARPPRRAGERPRHRARLRRPRPRGAGAAARGAAARC